MRSPETTRSETRRAESGSPALRRTRSPSELKRPCGLLALTWAAVAAASFGQTHDPAEHRSAQADTHASTEHHSMHRNPDGFQHSFEDVERWRARFEAADRESWQKPGDVIELMHIAPGMTVADIGAGTGYFLPALAEAVGPDGRVLGLDIEPGMVAFMAGRAHQAPWPQVEARQIAPDDPGLDAESVDRILIVNTWHHIGARPTYAALLRAALRSGGTVTVVDYTLDSPDGPPRQHRLPAEQIVAELEEGGLRAEVVEESLPYQFVVIGRDD